MVKIRRIFAAMLVAAVCAVQCRAVEVSADSAALYDCQSGTFFYEKNADKQRGMASTTKIMTAIVALENCRLDEEVDVKYEYTAVEGSKMYIKPNEPVSMKELLYGLLLSSGNDAAKAIAGHISGSDEEFAKLMNNKAGELGLKSTSFENPSGLDGENHYTTAKELALIADYAMGIPQFRDIVATKNIKTDSGRFLSNHNKMLKLYESADGIKTGFTKKCGRCLVSSATKNGRRLIAVTLNAPDDWNDHTNMLNYGFSLFEQAEICAENQEMGDVYVVSHGNVKIKADRAICLSLTEQEKADLTYRTEGAKMVYPPVKSGEKYGKLLVYSGGKEIASVDLLYTEDVQQQIIERKRSNILAEWFGF